MAKTKQQKVEMVQKLSDALKSATSTVFVGFTGLNVADETAMRRSLRGEKVIYTVVKKSLMKRALDGLGHKHADVPLEGELAVAYGGGNDVTAAARLVHEFGKKFKNPLARGAQASKLTILGGIFEGIMVGQGAMQEIAMIPPLDTLRGMFANIINSPRQRFAIALSEVAKTKSA